MSKLIDLTNRRYGRLEVVERDLAQKRAAWICHCDCGNITSVQSTHLRSGATKSCGCYQKERASEANTTHKETGTSLYSRWKSIIQRCTNPNNNRYPSYGGRGITVCTEWLRFEAFFEWSHKNGFKKGCGNELQLDRIDNNKGYSPENCRWCSPIDNNQNRRTTAKVDGMPLRVFATQNNLSYEKVHYIFYRLKQFNKETNSQNVLAYANQLPLNDESR